MALIKLTGTGYKFLPLGDLKKDIIGKDAYVIGNPLDLTHSVTKGVISGIRELEEPSVTLIQS